MAGKAVPFKRSLLVNLTVGIAVFGAVMLALSLFVFAPVLAHLLLDVGDHADPVGPRPQHPQRPEHQADQCRHHGVERSLQQPTQRRPSLKDWMYSCTM